MSPERTKTAAREQRMWLIYNSIRKYSEKKQKQSDCHIHYEAMHQYYNTTQLL